MKYLKPGLDQWLFVSEADFGLGFLFSEGELTRLGLLQQALTEQDIQMVVALLPPRGLAQRSMLSETVFSTETARQMGLGYQKLRAQLLALGWIVPDLLQAIKQQSQPQHNDPFYLPRDHHWSTAGAKLSAQAVAKAMRMHQQFSALKPMTFTTHYQGELQRFESFAYGAKIICGIQYQPHLSKIYKTMPTTALASALLDEAASPQVVVVGTSNSTASLQQQPGFNFSGFLKQALETDVLNQSLAGAGVDGALMHYFFSSEYIAGERPKFIVWELPVSALNLIDLNGREFYESLVLASQGCEPLDPGFRDLVQHDVTLRPGSDLDLTELVQSNPGARAMVVQYSNPEMRHFTVRVQYKNGASKHIGHKLPARIRQRLAYFPINQLHEPAVPIGSVYLDADDGYQFSTDIAVKLCR